MKGEDYRRADRPSAGGIVRTGRERGPLWRHGKLVTMREVWHIRCGYQWWTKHPDAARKPAAYR